MGITIRKDWDAPAPKKKMGRPRTQAPGATLYHVWLSPEHRATLESYADQNGMTLSDAMRKMLDEVAAR